MRTRNASDVKKIYDILKKHNPHQALALAIDIYDQSFNREITIVERKIK
jgi:hypothetical protein